MRDSCGIFAESLRDAEFFRGMRNAGCGVFAESLRDHSLRNAGFLRDAGFLWDTESLTGCGIDAGCGIYAEYGLYAESMRDLCGIRDSCGILVEIYGIHAGFMRDSLQDADSLRNTGIFAECGIFAGIFGNLRGIRDAGLMRDAESLRDPGCGIWDICGTLAGCGIRDIYGIYAESLRNLCGMRDSCGISAGFMRDAGSLRDFGGILVQDTGCGIFVNCGIFSDGGMRNLCGNYAGCGMRDAECGMRDAGCGILAGCGIYAEFKRNLCGMRDAGCGILAESMRDTLRIRNRVDAGFTRIRYWDKRGERVELMRLRLDSSALASVNSAVRSEQTAAASGNRSRSIPRHGRTCCYKFVKHSS